MKIKIFQKISNGVNKRIFVSLTIIVLVGATTIGGTLAYFNNLQTRIENTFALGEIDLKIDLRCENGLCGFPLRDLPDEPAFFRECDIKPGDSGEITISWHVYNLNAWGRLRLANIYNWENNCTEPETVVDPTCVDMTKGELGQYLLFTIWLDEGSVPGWQCGITANCSADPQEGDNILDGIETPIIANISANDLANTTGVVLPQELMASNTYYLGVKWTVPSGVGNIIQTDSLSAKIIMEVADEQF